MVKGILVFMDICTGCEIVYFAVLAWNFLSGFFRFQKYFRWPVIEDQHQLLTVHAPILPVIRHWENPILPAKLAASSGQASSKMTFDFSGLRLIEYAHTISKKSNGFIT